MTKKDHLYQKEEIKKTRYAGCTVYFRDLVEREDEGILADIYEVNYDVIHIFRLMGCRIRYQIEEYARPPEDTAVVLGEFTFPAYTEEVNHIVNALDRLTIRDRAGKNDVSITYLLDDCTDEEITDLIRISTEKNAMDVTAVLLEYTKNRNRDSIEELLKKL